MLFVSTGLVNKTLNVKRLISVLCGLFMIGGVGMLNAQNRVLEIQMQRERLNHVKKLQMECVKSTALKFEFCKNNPDYAYLDSCAKQLAEMSQRRDSILAEFMAVKKQCDSVANMLRGQHAVHYQDTLYWKLGFLDKDSCLLALDKVEVEIFERVRNENWKPDAKLSSVERLRDQYVYRKLSVDEQVVGYSWNKKKQVLTIFPLKTMDEAKRLEIRMEVGIKEYTKRGKEKKIVMSYSPSITVKKGKFIAHEKVQNRMIYDPVYSVEGKYYKINGKIEKWRPGLFEE